MCIAPDVLYCNIGVLKPIEACWGFQLLLSSCGMTGCTKATFKLNHGNMLLLAFFGMHDSVLSVGP